MLCCIPDNDAVCGEISDNSILECDYDKNVTNLYEAIEHRAWDSVQKFLETEKWSFLQFTKDIHSPTQQTRTWVTRFETDGQRVRWSQLPLHGAIIFGAPQRVVEGLIQLYPLSVRCTDDQRNLPLHLAFRAGSEDGIINLLIKSFPEALTTTNEDGSYPYAMDAKTSRKDYNETVQQIVRHVGRDILASHEKSSKEKTDALEGAIEVEKLNVKSLEQDKAKVEAELSKAKSEIEELRDRCEWLEKMVIANKISKAVGTPQTTTTPVASRENSKPPTRMILVNNLGSSYSDPEEFRAGTESSVVSSVLLNSVGRQEEFDRFDSALNYTKYIQDFVTVEARADQETIDWCGIQHQLPGSRKQPLHKSTASGKPPLVRKSNEPREGVVFGTAPRNPMATRSETSRKSRSNTSEWYGARVEKDHFSKKSIQIRRTAAKSNKSSVTNDSLDYSRDDDDDDDDYCDDYDDYSSWDDSNEDTTWNGGRNAPYKI